MTYKEIWNRLRLVDVTPYTEKKGSLSYLSWAHAWTILMDIYPESSYSFADDTVAPDMTATVNCTVSIGDCVRTMWLPVMDHRNKAIENPNARDISDARMRCLVKCLAMFGLGINVYAGEDFPTQATTPKGIETTTVPWIMSEEGQELVHAARSLSAGLQDHIGKEKTVTTIKAILDNASPFDYTYTKFDDPKMTKEDLETIIERIESLISEQERTPAQIDQQQTELAGMPD